VRVGGITIIRLRDGLIVEDSSSFDTFELRRIAGVVRVLRMAPRMLRRGRQRRLIALIVDPIAPNLAALRRVSSNVERA
jgi:hypothetical protein